MLCSGLEKNSICETICCLRWPDRKMKLVGTGAKQKLRCGKYETHASIFIGTIFQNSNLSLNQILDIEYFWAKDDLQKDSKKESVVGSNKTIVRWYYKLRIICYNIMIRIKPRKIGGN